MSHIKVWLGSNRYLFRTFHVSIIILSVYYNGSREWRHQIVYEDFPRPEWMIMAKFLSEKLALMEPVGRCSYSIYWDLYIMMKLLM